MPWVRFDDQFTVHRKVDGLSDTAFRLHVAAIFWCARNLTDGFVPEDDLDLVCARVRAPARFAIECVDRGTWHPPGTECDSPKCPANPEADTKQPASRCFAVHDYFEYQPTRSKVLKEREMKAAAGRIGGIISGQTRRSNAKRSNRKAKPKQNASRSLELPYPNPKGSPQPPASGGHDGSHPNCRECGTNPRGRPPPTSTPPPVADVLAPNGQPARGQAVHDIAGQARQAMRKDPP